MKNTELKIAIASAWLFMTGSAQALQPEVLYAFQREPGNPHASLVQGSDGHLYGTTLEGGNSGLGTVFQLTTNGILTSLLSFNGTNGGYPLGGLVLGSDGHLYGTTGIGGNNYIDKDRAGYADYGTVFKLTTNGLLTTLVSFTGTNGAYPEAGLVLGDDGNFYGTTSGGGTTITNGRGLGTVFKVTPNGVLTSLVSFNNADGANPEAGLVQGNDGDFYGTTMYGGSGATGEWDGSGTVFKVTTNGVLTMLFSFSSTAVNGNSGLVAFTNAHGANPRAGLVLGHDGNFYGTTTRGGSSGHGTVFKVKTNGVLITLVSFTGDNEGGGSGRLILGHDGNFYGSGGTVFQVTTNGVLTTLVSFNGDESKPQSGLMLGNDGNFYGAAGFAVFKMTANGVITPLASLGSSNGTNPRAGLVLGPDGHFYGTTAEGGSNGYGTVFQVTTNGVLTTLASFNYADGASPEAELVFGGDGNLYGTTAGGGTGGYGIGFGTVFRVTTDGVLTSLVSFTRTNGAFPKAALALGRDGCFYGTTGEGGSYGQGTVFRVTTNGVLTTLVSLTPTNTSPSGLVVGDDGHFYGTTGGTIFKVTATGVMTTLATGNMYLRGRLVLGRDGCFYGTGWDSGMVFKVTTNGVFTTLVYTGHYPLGLVFGSDGNLYGATKGLPKLLQGTLFKVTTNGVFTTLLRFDAVGFPGAIGQPPNGLVVGSDGSLYGTTERGGPGGGGTIFRLVISAFTNAVRQPGGSMLLTGTGPANGPYRLWASTDLSLPVASWTLLTSASFDSNGNFSYTEASAANNSSRFYQLSVS